MSTSPLQQVLFTAVDSAGLSTVTAIRSPTDPRPGAIYDPVHFAAAVPVHFHPTTSPSLGGTNYLMLSSQRWTNATVSPVNPGAYTAFTPASTPNWALVNAATGARTTVNSGFDIPMKTENDSRTLMAAVSRGNDMLWTLNNVAQGDNQVAVVQHFHNNTAINVTTLNGEETIPAIIYGQDNITFSAGLHWSSSTTPYMHAYGIGSETGQIYVARKKWSRMGYTGTARRPQDSQWEVLSSSPGPPGFIPVTTAAPTPVMTTSGPMRSEGPLSFGHTTINRSQSGMSKGWTGLTFMATVTSSSPEMSAIVYSSLGGRPWRQVGGPIPLGSTADGSYVGGNIQFHGHVGPNPAMIDAVNSLNAIPYSVTTMATSGGASSLVTNWGLLQVSRYA